MRSAVEWCDDHIEIIDQTLLPERLEIRKLTSTDDVVDAIGSLAVRGAPAIGVCAAYGMVLARREGLTPEEAATRIAAARPTAVNLSWAVDRVAVADDPLAEAIRIHDDDREACRRIGEFGRAELANVSRVLTHCNTGRLATAGIGTALGVVYAKAEAGEPIEVLATETRPLLQGARLTAWELADAGIPVTLISDSAAGSALRGGRVEAVIVGCDRVARNGDVANKVGTYSLAVLARVSDIPFYVAGPMSSFDGDTASGEDIPIEERGAHELADVEGVQVWNPAFDITPADLVTAFITDAGVLRPPYEESIGKALLV